MILERMEAVLDIFTLIDFPFWVIFTPRGKGDFMIQSVKTYMHQGVPNKSNRTSQGQDKDLIRS